MHHSAGTHHLAGLQHLAHLRQEDSATPVILVFQQPIISEQLVNIPQALTLDSQPE
jgi:hypothetical protein